MNKIQFVCVGVQKAGTSTLHDILNQHPEINLPEFKETHFFRDNDRYERGLDHYFQYHFKGTQGGLFGEVDPEYSYFEKCADRIYDCFGKIKIIFILRNPVDRAYSHYLMTKRRGLEELSFSDALEQESGRLKDHYSKIHYSYIDRGMYLEQIERFERIFGTENLRIYLFEDLIESTEKTVYDITDFLGLSRIDYDYDVKSNPAAGVRSEALRDFIYRPNPLKKSIGKIIPSKKIKDRIMVYLDKKNLKQSEKEVLGRNIKSSIYNKYFKSMIDELELKIGRDLSDWKIDEQG